MKDRRPQFLYQKMATPPATPMGAADFQLLEVDAPEGYQFASWQTVVEESHSFIVVLWERRLFP